MEPGYLLIFERLGAALAIGLLIGTERGWSSRRRAEGERVAGLRTFGLIGLLGGLWSVLGARIGEWSLAVAFAALAGILIVAQASFLRRARDVGATTMVAALVTFGRGALAGYGELAVAGAGAVIVTLLLGVKPELHGLVSRMRHAELIAVIKLLLMSVVLLPILPDRGYGPWHALNPYSIWWMVVLIAGISFAGYLAIRVAGTRLGIFLTGIFGGLASSTATAIALARLGRRQPELRELLSAGVIVASATMFPRMLLLGAVVAPAYALKMAWPLGLAAVAAYGVAAVTWRSAGARLPATGAGVRPRNPFELAMALQFGAFLALVMVLSHALQAWLGTAGVYVLAAASGLGDVDAVTLSFGARAAEGSLPSTVAAGGALLAAAVNTGVKAGLVAVICGGVMAWRVILGLGAALASGVLGLAIETGLHT